MVHVLIDAVKEVAFWDINIEYQDGGVSSDASHVFIISLYSYLLFIYTLFQKSNTKYNRLLSC